MIVFFQSSILGQRVLKFKSHKMDQLNSPDADLRAAVLNVYRGVWTEFQQWEPGDGIQTLESLQVASVSSPVLETVTIPRSRSLAQPQNYQETFVIEDFEGQLGYEIACDLVLSDSWTPYPRYFCCPPTSRNILRDHVQDFSCLFPLEADNDSPVNYPDFKLDEHLEGFDSFAWQIDFRDPDLEMVELEAVRRLHFGHGYSLEDLHYLAIFKGVLHPESINGSLLWEISQRDPLRWPGSKFSKFPELRLKKPNFNPDIFEAVNKDLPEFCPFLNCIHSRCQLHKMPEFENPAIQHLSPTYTNTSMTLSEGDPCGNDCFRHHRGKEEIMELVHWDDERVINDFTSLMKFIPDVLPCKFSKILRKPCFEVFVYRNKLYSDIQMLNKDPSDSVSERSIVIKPSIIKKQTSIGACYHLGKCDRASGCLCYQNNQHCQRHCRCDNSCKIRWTGCQCAMTDKSEKRGLNCMQSENCPCRNAGRQCDPELCIHCDAKGAEEERRCFNNDVLRAQPFALKIALGSFGLGAFTTCDLPADAYLGEYVGESIDMFQYDEDTPRILDIMPHFTNLNYNFSLNRNTVLDSLVVGNETRYLNHSTYHDNVVVYDTVSSGTYHLIMYTVKPVTAGQELLLHYGEDYFRDGLPDC